MPCQLQQSESNYFMTRSRFWLKRRFSWSSDV